MRSALRDAELPPPAGGWERLERELGGAVPGLSTPEKAPRGSVWRIYWPRIAAAAAVVLLGVVAGDYMLRPDKALENDGNVIASAVEKEATAATMPQSGGAESIRETLAQAVGLTPERTDAEVPAAGRRTLLARAVTPAATEPAAVAETAEPAAVAETAGGTAPRAAEEQSAADAPQTTSETAAKRPATRSSARVPARTSLYDEPLTAYKPPRRKASFSLFAGGGVTGGANGTAAMQPMYSSMTNDVSSVVGNGDNMSLMPRGEYKDNSFRHHQPLSFGLSVRKEFAHGLSLESGVNYTLLRSDVKVRFSSEDVSQKLHFIGVPLRMNWQFMERGRFSLYIGAGGMAEKCVSAKFGSESVDEPGVQWSALAAVGAQYRLGNTVGLYFEPEGSYYFTETGLKTARTDSPFTLTLRLGVRLSF